MNVLLTNFGTAGDIVPLLALARELRAAGHDTVMACATSHAPFVASQGIAYAEVGPDLRDEQTAINQRWIEDESASASTADMHTLLAPLARAIPETYETLRALARRADVLISGPAQPAARMVHETTAVPFVSVQFSNFGGIGTPALQAATAALINPFRARLRLQPLANPVTLDANSPQLALYAMSRHLLPRPPAWPAHLHIVGFFFLDQPDWLPDPALRAFLDAGDPPAIFSFGSMPHTEPSRILALIDEAAARAGVRAVIQQAASDPDARVGPNLHIIGFAPHAWLFSRAGCVVHHGGAGTAAAAFRAGKPTVFVPHGAIFDQTYWAQLSRDHGCSGEPMPFQALTAPRLAASLRECLDRDDRRHNAARIGLQVQMEHGVQTARRAIEDLVRRVGLADPLHV